MIRKPFNKSQGEDFCGTGLEFAEGASQRLAQFGGVAVPTTGNLYEFDGAIRLTGSKHVECCIDGGAPEVTLFIVWCLRSAGPAQQAQEDGLQDILGVSRVARDAVGGAEDETVVRPKSSLEFVRNGDCRFLCQYASQGTPPWS